MVFMQTEIPQKHALLIEYLKQYGLIEVVRVDSADGMCTEFDFLIAERTRKIARDLVSAYLPSMLAKSGYRFSEADVFNLSQGMQLDLGDKLYDKLRTILIVLDACGLGREHTWLDYDYWAFPNLRASWVFSKIRKDRRWWRNAVSTWPNLFMLVARKPESLSRLCSREMSPGFVRLSGRRPQTLLLGRTERPAYAVAAEYIGQAEARLGKRFTALFRVRHPIQESLMKYLESSSQVFSGFCFNSSSLKLGQASLEIAMPNKRRDSTVHLTLDRSHKNFAPVLGIHSEIWLACLINETIRATNNSLGALVSFYNSVMNHSYFSEVETLVCSPSRNWLFVPVVCGLRAKGVAIIEYQALFWSDHVRYEVRDMDLFVCSDAASMKIIKNKYDIIKYQPKIILGPSFYLANFIDEYDKRTSRHERLVKPAYVGLALQPIRGDIFEAACRIIRGRGFNIVIRPHPNQDRAWVESRFGSYGKIDDGNLIDFIHGASLVVSGFSNILLQAAIVGKTAVSLPVSDNLVIDIASASERIHLCNSLRDLSRILGQASETSGTYTVRDAVEEWCEIRRTNMREQFLLKKRASATPFTGSSS